MVACHDGVWRYTAGGRSIAIHGRQPERDADRLADEALAANPPGDLIIAIGAGLGFVLDALERRQWSGRVLVLEPDAETAGPCWRAATGRRSSPAAACVCWSGPTTRARPATGSGWATARGIRSS